MAGGKDHVTVTIKVRVDVLAEDLAKHLTLGRETAFPSMEEAEFELAHHVLWMFSDPCFDTPARFNVVSWVGRSPWLHFR